MRWIRIEASHMTAHADLAGPSVGTGRYDVAPIIKYMAGWHFDKVREYCRKKGWTLFVYEKLPGRERTQLWPKELP